MLRDIIINDLKYVENLSSSEGVENLSNSKRIETHPEGWATQLKLIYILMA